VVLCGQSAVLGDVLDVDTIRDNPALLSASYVVLTVEFGEPPLQRSHDLLSAGELELGSAEGLDDVGSVGVLGSHGEDDLANADTGSHLHGLAVRASHTTGQTICTSAGQHLVLTNDVERVGSAADVVAFLAGGLGQVLVAGHTGSLQRAGGQLLLLVGHQVGDEGELVDRDLLGSTIKDSDLCIGNTSAISRLDVGLVLLETNTTSGSCTQTSETKVTFRTLKHPCPQYTRHHTNISIKTQYCVRLALDADKQQ
jgi:hypothetical protein